MKAKLIKTEKQYKAALARVESLMNAAVKPGTPKGDELELLAVLVDIYENKHDPIGLPNPIEAIRFRMEQTGLRQQDLVPFIGSRGKVSEVLHGKRPLSITMIRALHEHLAIPVDVLLQPSTVIKQIHRAQSSKRHPAVLTA